MESNKYEQLFRRLQESRRGTASDVVRLQYNRGKRILDNQDKRRLARLYEGLLLYRKRSCSSSGRYYCGTDLVHKNNIFTVMEVESQLFHDIFEINRTFLKFGELVDLQDSYSFAKCFLTSDGLAGFAIEPTGNLVSVFSLYGDIKKGFLYAIKDYALSRGATHCDCYDSFLQPLPVIYEKTLGFQEASRMAYNMAYDHDGIAERHNKPDVVFMVSGPEKVFRKSFSELQYDEAKAYQQTWILKQSNAKQVLREKQAHARYLNGTFNNKVQKKGPKR